MDKEKEEFEIDDDFYQDTKTKLSLFIASNPDYRNEIFSALITCFMNMCVGNKSSKEDVKNTFQLLLEQYDDMQDKHNSIQKLTTEFIQNIQEIQKNIEF